MEPRYNFPAAAAMTLLEARFLGGVERYDLWYGGDGKLIRIVWGHTVNDWDSYSVHTKTYYHKEDGRPQGGDLDLIFQYVCLFAPDVARDLRLVED